RDHGEAEGRRVDIARLHIPSSDGPQHTAHQRNFLAFTVLSLAAEGLPSIPAWRPGEPETDCSRVMIGCVRQTDRDTCSIAPPRTCDSKIQGIPARRSATGAWSASCAAQSPLVYLHGAGTFPGFPSRSGGPRGFRSPSLIIRGLASPATILELTRYKTMSC